ncbi:MAG: GNAT family N-acetyltransferase [Candidatus Marinimicrobia bacterium]|nr:GNAT family N-acetyltransferase [Candidatus Neomarinimicrobiota bacterium]
MIRKYEEKDIDELIEVWYPASKLAHPFLKEEYFEQERKKFTHPNIQRTETLVYEKDNKVVGFITLMNELVYAFFVDIDFQHSGIGRALMDHAKSIRPFLELYVFKDNEIGRKFYKKYGFIELSKHRDKETGFTQLKLKLKLTY